MIAFAYTVIITENNSITEISGVVSANDIEEARRTMIANGYLVRDLRPARPEEVRIEALRQKRNKLAGVARKLNPQLPLIRPIRADIRAPWMTYLILVATAVFIAICVILFGGKHA